MNCNGNENQKKNCVESSFLGLAEYVCMYVKKDSRELIAKTNGYK